MRQLASVAVLGLLLPAVFASARAIPFETRTNGRLSAKTEATDVGEVKVSHVGDRIQIHSAPRVGAKQQLAGSFTIEGETDFHRGRRESAQPKVSLAPAVHRFGKDADHDDAEELPEVSRTTGQASVDSGSSVSASSKQSMRLGAQGQIAARLTINKEIPAL